jgi:hypothetical protein
MIVSPHRLKSMVSHIPGGMIGREIRGIFGRAVTVAFTLASAVSIIIVLNRLCHAIAIPVYQRHYQITVNIV